VNHRDPDTDGKKEILDRPLRQSTYTTPMLGRVMSTTLPEEEVS
jgi:hypothetical protein